ncbi:hypothetical protein U1763_00060 [Sphingomonas sp. LB2R24]|uniref:hypothetical protein n=1 Tax=Sphingomonas sorbitolis TaxID=3096165 RepID=UPI002FC5ABBA
MTTIRGFVEALEISRAGQASAFLLHGDGSRATYTIADLDADPERFNERLSQLGLLRDAMDRAEPVELEFDNNEDGGAAVTRVRRLTRDALERPRETTRASGQVVGLAIGIESRPDMPEPSDWAVIALLIGGSVERFTIQLQTPERSTAIAMVEIARAAQTEGGTVTVEFDDKNRMVTSIVSGGLDDTDSGKDADEFDAFVEEIAHGPGIDMMQVAVTTAPPFAAGDGNVVALVAFTPESRALLVLRGSPEYALFEAGLRDKLRMRVASLAPRDRETKEESGGTETRPNDATNGAPAQPPTAVPATPASPDTSTAGPEVIGILKGSRLGYDRGTEKARPELVRGAHLLAPLCSAARPVWIQVNRHALDVGPEGDCLEGLPTSDLSPRSMREINLPYRAEWCGVACCNHGVYRFQFDLDVDFTVFVDDEELCVHADEKRHMRFAHACLDGEHDVRVVLESWTCRQKFVMDVYRIR